MHMIGENRMYPNKTQFSEPGLLEYYPFFLYHEFNIIDLVLGYFSLPVSHKFDANAMNRTRHNSSLLAFLRAVQFR